MSLKQSTVSGLKWSFAESFVYQGINFLVGVILARILSPQEFGLIGMMSIFVAISQTLVDSGFSQALIRKSNCTKEDYSTIFFLNSIIGIVLYLVLFLSSGLIGTFYHEPILSILIQVIGFNLVINSLALVQRALMIKNINFKTQTTVSAISSILSGIISIWMAYAGWGVWSLVWKTLLQNTFTTTLLWYLNSWRPVMVFRIDSIREMFGFSFKLLLTELLNTIFNNIYYLVIGKYYSATELGFYTRADQFKNLPSQNITTVIQRVSYPVLSSIQNDSVRLKNGYKSLIKNSMFLTFTLMIGLSAMSGSFVVVLIGERWLNVVPYLRVLCFAGMLYPLHALNLNMLKVLGKSDLLLKLEIIKKILFVPTIIIGVFWGMQWLVYGVVFNSFVAYLLNSYWSGKLINYSVKEQIVDIIPSFTLSMFVGICLWFLEITFLGISPTALLLMQSILGFFLVVSISEISKNSSYLEIKNILFNKPSLSKS